MRKKVVFIVDDDKMMQHFLEYSFISRDDFLVKPFYDPEECLSNLGLNPDIIVLDHTFVSENKKMLNGLETLKKLKEINPALPVIILSRHKDEDLKKQYFDTGVMDFIVKDDYFLNVLLDSIEQITVN